MKKVFLIVAALIVLGCSAKSPEIASPQNNVALTPSPTPSPPMHTPTPSETPAVPELKFGVKYPARVIYIYDGDTIKVNLSGQILVIRLLGVDTPEKSAEDNKPNISGRMGDDG